MFRRSEQSESADSKDKKISDSSSVSELHSEFESFKFYKQNTSFYLHDPIYLLRYTKLTLIITFETVRTAILVKQKNKNKLPVSKS